MKKLILLFSSILSITVSANCLDFKVKSSDMKLNIKKDTATISYKGFESNYHCKNIGKKVSCYGDDDSGQFSIDLKSKKMKITSLTFGEPDGESISISKKDLSGISCK